jgi:excisionase family DNA binding protein
VTLPYPPPYQDLRTLAEHLCLGESTVEEWVKLGKLPAARKKGGKRLWKWKEVEEYLDRADDNGAPCADAEAQRITNATRQAASRNN